MQSRSSVQNNVTTAAAGPRFADGTRFICLRTILATISVQKSGLIARTARAEQQKNALTFLKVGGRNGCLLSCAWCLMSSLDNSRFTGISLTES